MESCAVGAGRLLGRVRLAAAIAGLLGVAALAEGTLIPVGSGADEASVQIDFADGASYTFEVAFDGLATGMGLLDIIEANTTLTTVRNDYGWGVFVEGFIYEGHSNTGYGGGENWWHYWVQDLTGAWISPPYGAAMRTVTDGSADGWVYGRADAPLPEPATALLLGVAGGVLLRRSRRVR
jgi:hypothetical protein